jgi:hypothetical protein
MAKIEETFNRIFRHSDIQLPHDAVENGQKGNIRKNSWNIDYIFGQDENGKYLEYYTMNRFTNDHHERIYENGERAELPARYDWIFYGGNLTREEAEKKYHEHNRKVDEYLDKMGLRHDPTEFLESLKNKFSSQE